MAFEFNFPVGGGKIAVGTGSTIGVTYLLNDNMSVRADFGLDAVLSTGGGPANFTIGAGLRMYQVRKGPVAVFLWPTLIFSRAGGLSTITIAGGAGVEYFFAEHLSIGGQLGLGLSFGNIGGPAGSSVTTQLTTATSGLFAAVYF